MSNGAAIEWEACAIDELDARAWHDILKLRIDVFIVEQNCPYPELDGLDLEALHVTGFSAEGWPVAYCRILPPQRDGLPPHIGRVVVEKAHRGTGLGKQLMRVALRSVRQRYGSPHSALAAQAHLQAFYEELGYRVTSEAYILDGIPHVDMERSADHPLT
jgi:ElaA protein